MELFTKEQVSVLKNEASEQTLIKVKLNKNHGNFEKGQIVYIREDPIEYVIDDAKSRIYSCGSYIGDVIKETPQKDEFPIHPYLWLCICKGGHVTRKYYYEMYIVIKAKTEKEAYDKAKNCPRVKHDDPEFMLERPINISEQRYNEIKADNAKDPYFKATNSSECRYSDCLHQERIVEEPNYICDGKKKTKRNFFKKL